MCINPEVWRRQLSASWHPGALDVVTKHPRSLSRAALADYARAALDDDLSPETLVRTFTACQMWGSGRTNGRGPRHTRAALEAPEAIAVLQRVARCVVSGDVGPTYRRQLPGWGASFVTKYTYALALALDDNRPRALILDARVWEGLAALGWSSAEAAHSRLWAHRYSAYVAELHRWAEGLQCRPDSIEWLLFDRRGYVSATV